MAMARSLVVCDQVDAGGTAQLILLPSGFVEQQRLFARARR
jgi:hypothetical protein